MKKLLFLPLVLITCLCFAQDAKQIIGKPVKIDNILVAQNDFPDQMEWEEAKRACRALGNGWRLPTKAELNILYRNRRKIGGFSINAYWSSAVSNNYGWFQYFGNGFQNFNIEGNTAFVRAVKSL
jgi:hypothetical protein